MKRFLSLLLLSGLFAILILGLTLTASARDEGWLDLEPIINESVRDGISPPIGSVAFSSLARSGLHGEASLVEVPMFMRSPDGVEGLAAGTRVSSARPQRLANFASANLLQSFEGAENDDNDNLVGFLLYPPDTDGDVGPNHYMQMTNLVTTIFDKSGNTLLGPFPNNVFWTGLGGDCEFTNQGDPIVLYDEETDRWLASQFAFDNAFTRFSLCLAISTTGDPTGSYYQHEFDFTDIGFPDYPKYGFATGAIGVMVNLFDPATGFGFGGSGLGAIDKAEAFSDRQTTMIFYNVGQEEFGFVVGDNDGPKFNNVRPTFATNNDGTGDTIDFWEIKPKFRNPAESQIREFPPIPVSPIDGDLCNAVRERCMDQPPPGTRLETISDRLMHRMQIRNLAGSRNNRDSGNTRAVVTHTVDADGSGKAGIRWYEFRLHGNEWILYQEGTYSPDADHRWMGSIAMNFNGDICVGYSISSVTTYPSIGAACQSKGASGSGELDTGELLVYDGNPAGFVQTGTASRWGDYSAMAIDPVDDTFWYTTEYASPNTRLGQLAGWATKVAQLEVSD